MNYIGLGCFILFFVIVIITIMDGCAFVYFSIFLKKMARECFFLKHFQPGLACDIGRGL